jgi:DNA-binding transcriptional ArsR family regulator
VTPSSWTCTPRHAQLAFDTIDWLPGGCHGVFTALADPTRRAILGALAAGGPAAATDLAVGLPITRQAIAKHLALLAGAGLVTAEPGERRRVRYRLRSAPMQVAQQFLAALARDWDSPLGALKHHLDRSAPTSTSRN